MHGTQDTKTFPKCYVLEGMASEISKTTHTSVWIAGAKAKCAH